MKVLLTNNHMDVRAGSELLVTELAEGLRARGHEVAVFTLFPGQFATEWASLSDVLVLSPLSGDDLVEFEPDVVHVTHWPTLLYLRAVGLTAPCAYAFLGVIPPLENPPPLTGGDPALAWCVSEEVAGNIAAIDGWPGTDDLAIVRTSIAPGFESVRCEGAVDLRRVAVVSNHFPERYRTWVVESCAEMGIGLDLIGLPDNPMEITPDHLASYDAVISLGRTAIAAAAMGIPTLILDSSGSDGWLTTDNLRRAQRHNYSGRGHGIDPDRDQVRDWLSSPPTRGEVDDVAQIVRHDHDFGVGLERIEALLTRAAEQTAPQVFGRHTGVVPEYLRRIVHQQTVIDHRTFERDRAEGSLEEAQSAAHQAQAALLAAVAERDDARHARDVARHERDDAVAERDAMTSSTSWRVTAPLRSITGRRRTT